MDHQNNIYSSDEDGDGHQQVRKTNSTKWLKSSNASLSSLQQVKPVSVYNFGLSSPKDLKATNLTSNRSSSVTNLVAEPVLQSLGSQKTAWGSNGSIPDLLKNQRPGSASSSRTCARRHPPPGKKARPQSAKDEVIRTSPGIAVKGAKYNPIGKPPKSFAATIGWIGPPAGMKFTEPLQVSDEPKSDNSSEKLLPPPPPSPSGSPRQHIEVDLQSNVTEEDNVSPRIRYTHGEPQRTPTPPHVPPVPIHLMLPSMYDDVEEDEDELNTDRLLLMAEEHIQADKKAESVNDFIEKVSSANHSANDLPGFTYTHLNGRTSQESKLEIYADGDTEVVSWEKEDVNDSFEFSDFSGPPDNSPRSDSEMNQPPPLEKVSVKFSEEKNVTINITPRNAGHKVAELHVNKKKNINSSENGDLNTLLSIYSARADEIPTSSRKKTVSLTEMKHETKSVRTLTNNKSYTRSEKPSNESLEFKFTSQDNIRCERTLLHKPRTPPSNRPSTPLTSVTVAYCDLDDNKKRQKRYRGIKSEKDVVTLVQQVQVSDSDDEKNEDVITPNKLESWMPTKTTSQRSQNYYELSRKAQKQNSKALQEKFDAELVKGAPLIKTIKTIELDDSGNDLKETKTQSFIDVDNQTSAYHEKDRQQREATRIRSKPRPASEMLPRNPKLIMDNEKYVNEEEKKMENGHKKAHRPSSAPIRRRPSSGKKERKLKDTFGKSQNSTKELTDKNIINVTQNGNEAKHDVNNKGESVGMDTDEDKMSDISFGHESGSDVDTDLKTEKDLEIEKIIEKHLGKPSQTVNLLPEKVHSKSNKMQSKSTQEKTSERKLTAHLHSHCSCPTESKQGSKKISTMTVQLPSNNKSDKQMSRVYGAYARRKSAPPLRTITKSKPPERPRTVKPVYITSKNPDDVFETEENIECQQLQAKLAANGVNVKAETLERALYPPSGRTKYYEINAQLPDSTSSNLLSHPREWLPIEYRHLKLAEKALDRANDILYKQRMAEDRRARLMEMAKKKVKGKRRSKSKEKKKDETDKTKIKS